MAIAFIKPQRRWHFLSLGLIVKLLKQPLTATEKNDKQHRQKLGSCNGNWHIFELCHC